jgi:hypothetical protein
VDDAALDCPNCPGCGLSLGTPITLAEVERWDGPPEATLWCPSCGAGWLGSPADLARAEAAWLAYERAHEAAATFEAATTDDEPDAPVVDPRQLPLIGS